MITTASEAGPASRLGQVAPLEPGDPRSVGGYPLVGRLGAGGMGTVYLGRGRALAGGTAGGASTLVAVKVIHPDLARDHGFRGRFADEVAAARRVSPFCTARVLDADPTAAQPYLVTEYVDGVTLARAVSDRGALDESTLYGVALGVASALVAIHRAGVVHRDLKPGNVLLSLSGPRVIDFGIARALDAATHRTAVGVVLGTPGWMAPEQLRGGQVGPSADVFSWGSLIGYAAIGRSPWGNDGPPTALAHRIIDGEPALDGLGGQLRTLVLAALRKDPTRRPTASELVQALLGGQGGGAAGVPVTNPTAAATSLLERTWVGPSGWAPLAAGSAGSAAARAAAPRTAVGTPFAGSPPLSHTLQPRAGTTAYQSAPDQARRSLAGGPGGLGGPGGGVLGGTAAVPPGQNGRPGPARRRWYSKKRYYVLLLAVLALLLVNSATNHALSWWDDHVGTTGSQSGPRSGGPNPSQQPSSGSDQGSNPSGTIGDGSVSDPTTDPTTDPSGGGSPTGGGPADGGTGAGAVPAGIGTEVRDGQFAFVVNSLQCGRTKVGKGWRAQHPQGQYCLADVSVRNAGTETRQMFSGSQKLIDSAGDSHSPSEAATLAAGTSLIASLDPGDQARGTLVFDIPTDAQAALLELHDSPLSAGVQIKVTG